MLCLCELSAESWGDSGGDVARRMDGTDVKVGSVLDV